MISRISSYSASKHTCSWPLFVRGYIQSRFEDAFRVAPQKKIVQCQFQNCLQISEQFLVTVKIYGGQRLLIKFGRFAIRGNVEARFIKCGDSKKTIAHERFAIYQRKERNFTLRENRVEMGDERVSE